MAGNIRLEIVTPQKSVVSEDAQIVVAPGTLGEFGVLVGHTPFLSTLKVGTLRYTDAKGNEHYVFVSGGFAEALPDKVTILAESAERRRDIDINAHKVHCSVLKSVWKKQEAKMMLILQEQELLLKELYIV
jgi:F-type H+-transporting ATPase subunit epsilon